MLEERRTAGTERMSKLKAKDKLFPLFYSVVCSAVKLLNYKQKDVMYVLGVIRLLVFGGYSAISLHVELVVFTKQTL